MTNQFIGYVLGLTHTKTNDMFIISEITDKLNILDIYNTMLNSPYNDSFNDFINPIDNPNDISIHIIDVVLCDSINQLFCVAREHMMMKKKNQNYLNNVKNGYYYKLSICKMISDGIDEDTLFKILDKFTLKPIDYINPIESM